jgi:hypothetical protein
MPPPSVHAYHIASATLVLKLQFPDVQSRAPTVLASIDHILENADRELVQTGSWLNIVGYVTKPVSTSTKSKSSDKRRRTRNARLTPLVEVYMMWSAGTIDLAGYTSAVRNYQGTLAECG